MYYPVYLPSYNYHYEKSLKWLIENNIEFINLLENMEVTNPSKIFFMSEEQCLHYKLSDIDNNLKVYEIEDTEYLDIISANTSLEQLHLTYSIKIPLYTSYENLINEIKTIKNNYGYCISNYNSSTYYDMDRLHQSIYNELNDYYNAKNMYQTLLSIIFDFINKKP